MYEIGAVYIWQNQVGEMAHLNGTECTVLEAPEWHWDAISESLQFGQMTDSPCPEEDCDYFADAGDLRRKQPPSGESSILDMFELPETEFA